MGSFGLERYGGVTGVKVGKTRLSTQDSVRQMSSDIGLELMLDSATPLLATLGFNALPPPSSTSSIPVDCRRIAESEVR